MDKAELCQKLKNEGYPDYIVKAFQAVERKNFVPREYREFAYHDSPLPIGNGQTISQPSTIAFMLSLLQINDRSVPTNSDKKIKILEVGSGSGYVLALIEKISKKSEIYGTERIKEIFIKSINNIKGNNRINIRYTPDKFGLPEFSPFDRIIVSASADMLPLELIEQLKNKAIMVCPVKNSIFKIVKNGSKIAKQEFFGFKFVPLIM